MTSKFAESKHFKNVSVALTFFNKENTGHLNLSFSFLCFILLLWSSFIGNKNIRPLQRFGLSDIGLAFQILGVFTKMADF